MKNKLLGILLIGILVIGLTGRKSKVKLEGRYEWRPYKNLNDVYAYYEFSNDGKCIFTMQLGNQYQVLPINYNYTISKIDKNNYEITLVTTEKDETVTLKYNANDDILVDEYFKNIETSLEETSRPSDNDEYGQFVKIKK